MIRNNLTLLPNCSGKVSFEGEPMKAVGYYSYDTNSRLNTISIHTIDFTGRIYIYGTLSVNPSEKDWAIIPLSDETPYIEFNHGLLTHGVRDNRFVNIKGAYTWLKAKMDRSYIEELEEPKPILTHISTGTYSNNVLDVDSTPMSNRLVEVQPEPSLDLAKYGNVECIKLTY